MEEPLDRHPGDNHGLTRGAKRLFGVESPRPRLSSAGQGGRGEPATLWTPLETTVARIHSNSQSCPLPTRRHVEAGRGLRGGSILEPLPGLRSRNRPPCPPAQIGAVASLGCQQGLPGWACDGPLHPERPLGAWFGRPFVFRFVEGAGAISEGRRPTAPGSPTNLAHTIGTRARAWVPMAHPGTARSAPGTCARVPGLLDR